jgi:DNA-directed RNA polymerase specialized sigma24 family protein
MTKRYFSSKEELIGSEYDNIKDIAFNILKSNNDLHFLDDLVQDICVILLTQNKESIMTIHEQGHFNFYVARVVANQVLSSTSPFHKKYRLKLPKIDLTEEDYNDLADKFWSDVNHLLSNKQRLMINLRYVYCLKVEQIGSIFAVSKRQIYKDLNKIFNILEKNNKM